MTNEEAIKHIEKHKIHHGISEDYGNHVYLSRALDMAIEALRDIEKMKHTTHAFMRRCRIGLTVPCEQCNIDDCIARKEGNK